MHEDTIYKQVYDAVTALGEKHEWVMLKGPDCARLIWKVIPPEFIPRDQHAFSLNDAIADLNALVFQQTEKCIQRFECGKDVETFLNNSGLLEMNLKRLSFLYNRDLEPNVICGIV